MCKKHYQGTAPLLDCPFIKIIASQRLKPFGFFSHWHLFACDTTFDFKGIFYIKMYESSHSHSLLPQVWVLGPALETVLNGQTNLSSRGWWGDKNQTWNSDSRRWTLPRHVRCYGNTRCWPYLGLRKPSLKSWRLCWEQEEDGTVFEAP